jgi:hypothetical protein
MTLELLCRDVVFHFNKKHLEDAAIPMWVIKTSGKTYYVDHVTSTVPWSTKETPNNAHTKGAIKLKKVKLTINDDNEATIEAVTSENSNFVTADKAYARIIFNSVYSDIQKFLIDQQCNIGHFKTVYGGCGTKFFIVDIFNEEDIVLLKLSHIGWRILNENEEYYKIYNDPTVTHVDGDEDDSVYED